MYTRTTCASRRAAERVRYIHVSGYGRTARRSLPPLVRVSAAAGVTFNVGRNAAKRAKRARR